MSDIFGVNPPAPPPYGTGVPVGGDISVPRAPVPTIYGPIEVPEGPSIAFETDQGPEFQLTEHQSWFDLFIFTAAGLIGTGLGLMRAAATSILQSAVNEVWLKNPNRPIPAETAAVMATKNVHDYTQLSVEANKGGISTGRFRAMVDATGNPPGPLELVDRWRLGIISDGALQHGIRQGLIKDEWLDFFRSYRHVPASAIEYLQAAVQGHIGLDQAISKADGLGLTSDDANMIYETLGNPPGIQEMITLLNRGVMTQAEVEQGIRESRYKNKYIPAILAFRRHWPPPRTVTALLRNGAYTEAQARDRFQGYGLDPEDATAYIASALHGKTASHKELAVGTVKALYADRVINRDQAMNDLAKVGYAGPEALLILDLADAQARQKVKNQIVSHVHHLYVTHRIAEDVARAELVKIGVDEGHITDLLELWTWERQTPSRHLSIGQLNSAFKKGFLTRAEFVTRVTALGYTQPDAELLSELDVPLTAP